MKLLCRSQIEKIFSYAVVFVALILGPMRACAAELVMFEQAGCVWCDTFDRKIAPIYPKTAEGQRAPLRRVDLDHPIPQDLNFVTVERLTPVFVLIDKGREIGRIRGYPGEDNFWGLLGVMIKVLDAKGTDQGHDESREKPLHAAH